MHISLVLALNTEESIGIDYPFLTFNVWITSYCFFLYYLLPCIFMLIYKFLLYLWSLRKNFIRKQNNKEKNILLIKKYIS